MERKTISLKEVKICDPFWDRYTGLVPWEVIPYQRRVLYDEQPGVEKSHAIENLRIAAGLSEGDFYGFVFQDSDVAKWLEAVAFSLASHPDPELEAQADEVIALLERAQKENGYLDTYFQIREEGREFANLREGHELYCAGHLIEAGVAYHRSTGKETLLKICERLADHILECFQKPPLLRAIPGHEEIELALVKLYEETGKEAYLDMAAAFLDRRGESPSYFEEEMQRPGWKPIFPELRPEGYQLAYSQAHQPVRQQRKATGHAVRATYLYCAMADVAAYRQDEEMMEACQALYENITRRQMYVTGSIGSSGWLERFTTDYDLPNASNYSETCASIGLALFCRRMAAHLLDARYMDTAEAALYNTVLSGIALDGKAFFYVNPLSVWPPACMEATSLSHVKPVRQKWFGCACCPPNIARTLASLPEYAFFTAPGELFVNLYLSCQVKTEGFAFTVETRFPYEGSILFRFGESGGRRLSLRIPSYVKSFTLCRRLGGAETPLSLTPEKGYVSVEGPFEEGEELLLTFDLPVRRLRAHPQVRSDAGRVCLAKGPLVYCLEEEDNGENLEQLLLCPQEAIEEDYRPDLMGGTLVLRAKGKRELLPELSGDDLYDCSEAVFEEVPLTFVPYATWGNRHPGEMNVWIRAWNG